MPKIRGSTTFAVLSAGAVVAGCQSAPARYAGTGVHATYAVATTGATAVRTTGGELYNGAGRAIRAPLHDLNMMQDKIAPVLLRAETRPYDLAGVNSCGDVLNRVAELDLALGPDVDTPKPHKRTRVLRGADFAASTALDAAGTAAEHFIPMRGTIKQISGAQRYENHVKHATLAGETRRSFLKAIGMSHNCSWPAAPLDFAPTQVADVSAPWNAPSAAGAPVVLASTAGAAAPSPTAAAPGTAAPTAQPQTVPTQTVPTLAAPTPAAPAPAVLQTASLASLASPAPASRRAASPAVAPSSVRSGRPALAIAVRQQLSIPPVALPSADPAQSWRPASAQADVVEVSAPMTGSGPLTSGAMTSGSMTSGTMTNASLAGGSMTGKAPMASAALATSSAAAPWASSFASSSTSRR